MHLHVPRSVVTRTMHPDIDLKYVSLQIHAEEFSGVKISGCNHLLFLINSFHLIGLAVGVEG